MSETQLAETYNPLVYEIVQDLLERLGIVGNINVSDDGGSTYCVQIETEEPGILIGRHGETVGALQSIVKQIVHRRLSGLVGEFHLVLNVGDWRERREDVLRSLAMTAVARIKETREVQHIYDLSPSERRFVHILLSEDQSVATQSEGEGRDRHLVVKLRE